MLGFHFPDNFNVPYRATSIRDFWRRWHMTLSRFLRDYLYIPLGGSRNGWATYVKATLVTMGLCGLWHGAGFTFVVWGLAHGVALIVCRAWEARERPLPASVGWALTMLFVMLGWVLFRAPDFAAAGAMFTGMAGFSGLLGKTEWPAVLLVGAIVSILGPSTKQFIEEWLRPLPVYGIAFGLAAVMVVLEVGAGQPKSFIYFQF
jgi:D-alanyl-lipoteichoic acid acyltransferase DltB (MBOAT superfamily)